MEKDDLIVGRVRMNPIDNELVPCIEILMSEGLGDNQLVILKVVNSCYDSRDAKVERDEK